MIKRLTRKGSREIKERRRFQTHIKSLTMSKKRAFDVFDVIGERGEEVIVPLVATKTNNLPHDIDSISKLFEFGSKAFQLTTTKNNPIVATTTTATTDNKSDKVISMIKRSLPKNVYTLRGERGQKEVTTMLYDTYQQGLFMHGDPSSPVNQIIIPAFRYIFSELSALKRHDPKRIEILTTLAHACQDCQQVQAREILRIYQELTCQSLTFEDQLLYSMVRLKESALHEYITQHHYGVCDLDHNHVEPHQQRAHLWSAYLVIVGERYGLGNGTNITTAHGDRFLGSALQYVYETHEIPIMQPMYNHEFLCDIILPRLQNSISVKEWLTILIADINNQKMSNHTNNVNNNNNDNDVDRMIHRRILNQWAYQNLGDDKHRIFYDENHAEEYKDLAPNHPNPNNQYQPFLSPNVLTGMLVKVGMLKFKKCNNDERQHRKEKMMIANKNS